MEESRLGAVESRFADLIWENEPLTTGELVRLCLEKLEWKKSTTYTVLKKLCERGLFRNEGGIVSSVLSRQDYYARQSEKFVEDSFGGSLPAFLTAFTRRKQLSAAEIAEIQEMIRRMGKE